MLNKIVLSEILQSRSRPEVLRKYVGLIELNRSPRIYFLQSSERYWAGLFFATWVRILPLALNYVDRLDTLCYFICN